MPNTGIFCNNAINFKGFVCFIFNPGVRDHVVIALAFGFHIKAFHIKFSIY